MAMVRYTAMDAQGYLELALQTGVLDAFTASGSPSILVAATYRESHLMQSRLAFYFGTINKEVELALYLNGRIHRQGPRTKSVTPNQEPRPKKLVIVDDIKMEEVLNQLRDAYPRLQQSQGIEQILYFAKEWEGGLFTEFIPPRQTAQSSDTPAAA